MTTYLHPPPPNTHPSLKSLLLCVWLVWARGAASDGGIAVPIIRSRAAWMLGPAANTPATPVRARRRAGPGKQQPYCGVGQGLTAAGQGLAAVGNMVQDHEKAGAGGGEP